MRFKYTKRKSSGSYNKRGWIDIFTYIIFQEKLDTLFEEAGHKYISGQS